MYWAALDSFDAVSSVLDMPKQPAALVFCSPNDGLVDYSANKRWIATNQLNSWNLVDLDTSAAALKYMNHLIIDQNGMGKDSWDKMIARTSEFLDAAFPHQDSSG